MTGVQIVGIAVISLVVIFLVAEYFMANFMATYILTPPSNAGTDKGAENM